VKNILVTGGAGFIGSHTVVELMAAGYSPVIVDNLSNSAKSALAGIAKISGGRPRFYAGNYQDPALMSRILKQEKIDGVIHFAAFKAVGESVEQPLAYYQNNVAGFINLVDLLLKNGVNQLVFSSSAAVYGQPPVKKVTEETPTNPASPYGWSKLMDEVILGDACAANPSLSGVALRYFNVVGAHPSALIGERPKGRPQNLLPIIVDACQGKIPPFTVFGSNYPTPDGTCLRDYIHVVDLAKAHVAALQKLESTKDGYYLYNLGSGRPTSVMELIKTFEKVNGVKVPYKLGPRRAGDPAAYYASPARANKELGWRTTKTTEDAVADAWRWAKSSSK